jgi:Flp pilus assembly protein TadB
MVTTAAVLGLVLWAGSSPLPLLVAFLAFRLPMVAVVGAAAWVTRDWLRRDRGPTPDDEARFLEGVVTELHGGASPRVAVVRSAERSTAVDARQAMRAASLGLDSARLAASLARAMPLNGRLAGAAWAISSESGAPFGPVMQLLSQRAAERGRLLRERSALTAQARATAWIVAGLPMGLFLVLLLSGRVDVGPSLPVAVAGAALQLLGVAIVVFMLRSRP